MNSQLFLAIWFICGLITLVIVLRDAWIKDKELIKKGELGILTAILLCGPIAMLILFISFIKMHRDKIYEKKTFSKVDKSKKKSRV